MEESKKLTLNGVASRTASPAISKSVCPKEHVSNDAVIADGSGVKSEKRSSPSVVDTREVYFLITHFLSSGPCQRTCALLKDELLEHKLLPRRYHGWYSRTGAQNENVDDDSFSLPLSYSDLVERYSSIGKSHLVDLLNELLDKNRSIASGSVDAMCPTAADVPTLLGSGFASLLNGEQCKNGDHTSWWRAQYRWPHLNTGQVRALFFREIGGGSSCHHRAPSIRAARNAIAKPSLLVDRMQIIKTFRGHRNAVYCAIFDQTGEYIITGSDDRLVKIWSTSTGFCLRSCRGHDGDITDLAVNSSNNLVASASNDFFIRVWSFPDGAPVSVLRGHTAAVTAIAFSPRQGCEHHILSSSDDGTCRIWDARNSSVNARTYSPRPEPLANGSKGSASEKQNLQNRNRILCCAFNASGMIFVTGSADKLARVWDACKWNDEPHAGPNHELDTLRGHEDDVNYVQFSGCAASSRPMVIDGTKDDRLSKFRNSWCTPESIVTCSRDGSAIIWVHHPRKKHERKVGKVIHYAKAYHLRVPPPPTPVQSIRGGIPRQKLLPTPRGVNMIVWSLDNCFVLAAIMDCRICVWNAVDGSLVHSLTGHTKSTFVLDVHPFNPRMAMSAGYDGLVIIWDIWKGEPIHVYETGEFNLVDGKFSPDGTSIVISDEVGQIYLIATGQGESQKEAKYDQFFLGDYRPLVRDVHGNVLDQEMQLPPHDRNAQDLLCDANMIPYAEPYQSMYQQKRLGAFGIHWRPPSMQLAVGGSDDLYLGMGGILADPQVTVVAEQGGARWVEQPQETEDVMDWEHDTGGEDTGSDYTASVNDTSDGEEREGSHSSSEELMYSLEDEDSDDECESSRKAYLRRSMRTQKKSKKLTGTSSRRKAKRRVFETEDDSSPVRRSKRQKRLRARAERSSSVSSSDTEMSKRPKRKAARNACFIFSQLSEADGDESPPQWQRSQSEPSENAHPEEEAQKSVEGAKNETDERKNDDTSPDADQSSAVAECSLGIKPTFMIKLRVPAQNNDNNVETADKCNGEPSVRVIAGEMVPEVCPGNDHPIVSECKDDTPGAPVKDSERHNEINTEGEIVQASSIKIEHSHSNFNGNCMDATLANDQVNMDLNTLPEESNDVEESEKQLESRDGHSFILKKCDQDMGNSVDGSKLETMVEPSTQVPESLLDSCTEFDSRLCSNQQPEKILKVFQRQRPSSHNHIISSVLLKTSDIEVISKESSDVDQKQPMDDLRMQLTTDDRPCFERVNGFGEVNYFEAGYQLGAAAVKSQDNYGHEDMPEQSDRKQELILDVNETPIEEMQTASFEERCTSGRPSELQLPNANDIDTPFPQALIPPCNNKKSPNSYSPRANTSSESERSVESGGSFNCRSDSVKQHDEYCYQDMDSKLSSDRPSQSPEASLADCRHSEGHVQGDNNDSFDEEINSARENQDGEMKIESMVTCIRDEFINMTALLPVRRGKGRRTKNHTGRSSGHFARPNTLQTRDSLTRPAARNDETATKAKGFCSEEEIVPPCVTEKSVRDLNQEAVPHARTSGMRSNLAAKKTAKYCVKSDITLSNTAFEEGNGISKLTCRKLERNTEGNPGIEESRLSLRLRHGSFVTKDPPSDNDEAYQRNTEGNHGAEESRLPVRLRCSSFASKDPPSDNDEVYQRNPEGSCGIEESRLPVRLRRSNFVSKDPPSDSDEDYQRNTEGNHGIEESRLPVRLRRSVFVTKEPPSDCDEGYKRNAEGNHGIEDSRLPVRLRRSSFVTKEEPPSDSDESNERDTEGNHRIEGSRLPVRLRRSSFVSKEPPSDSDEGYQRNIEGNHGIEELRLPVRLRRSSVLTKEPPSDSDEANQRNTEGNPGIEGSRFPVRLRRNSFVTKEPPSGCDEANLPPSSLSDALSGWKGKGGRSRKKLSSWLMLTQVEEGTRYIPQVGDEVAYVIQGHEEYLMTASLDEKGPLKTMRTRLRAVETCRVISISYNLLPGFATVCCRLVLKFIDESSKAHGRTMNLFLPELIDFPDFIVEKVRYDRAMARNWTKRDKCRVWWRSEDGKGGSWWEGRVVAVEAKSEDYPDSPWDRCTVQYRGDSLGGHKHSPWELFDSETVDSDLPCIDDNFPRIDDATKNIILSCIESAETCMDQYDLYGLKKLKQLVNRLDFLNRTLVPLSLDTVKARLTNNYYRSLDAIKHDIQLLVSNVVKFCSQESELPLKIRKLGSKILEVAQ